MDLTTQNNTGRILIVDDEKDFRDLLSEIISGSGYLTFTAADGLEALELVRHQDVDIALIDYVMPHLDGLQLMQELKKIDREIAVIFITGHGSIESAVSAMKEGAYDYISKPIQFEELENLLKRLFETKRLRRENRRLKRVLRQKYHFKNIIGNSPDMMAVKRKIEAFSQNREVVWICGETGTGKELVAKTIHFNSARSSASFVPSDCSVLTEQRLLEEWLGHEESTGTVKGYAKLGVFRTANKGTVFLQEISALSKKAQKILLETLLTGKAIPVGGQKAIPLDVRFIVTSKTDLQDLVEKKRFDTKLFDLLNSHRIDLPSLKNRKDDIPLLIRHFLQQEEEGISLDADALQILQFYSWPENVRELQNVLQSALAKRNNRKIGVKDLPGYLTKSVNQNLKPLHEIEKEAILHTLAVCNGDTTLAAKILQITPDTLKKKMKE